MTDSIAKFTPKGIKINKPHLNGEDEIELDVIILATGFDPVGSFASAFEVGGEIKFDKQKELYDNVPKAYLGCCLVGLRYL